MSEPSFLPIVQEVPLEAIRELRHRVLRGGQVQGEFHYPDDAEVTHLAVRDGDVVVSCLTVFPEAVDEESSAWRIRGMATDPSYQCRGCGRALIDEAIARARLAGVRLLWCNARTSAAGFYVRCGLEVVGPEFVTDTGLPHRRAVYRLAP
jgi:GNAT superfamily N-acetyltransferase